MVTSTALTSTATGRRSFGCAVSPWGCVWRSRRWRCGGTICPCDARRARAPPLCLADFALPRASCWMSTPLTLTATPTTLGTSRLAIASGAQGRRPPGGATAPAWLSLRGERRRSSAGWGDRPAVRTGREAVRRHLAFTRQQQQHSSSTAHPPPHPWGPPRTARHRALANTPRRRGAPPGHPGRGYMLQNHEAPQ